MTEAIYFLSDGGSSIKIGYSRNAHRRAAAIAAGDRAGLSVVGFAPGRREHERALHDRLSDYRQGGEWFRDCGVVRDLISTVMTSGVGVLGVEERRKSEFAPIIQQALDLARLIIRYSALFRPEGGITERLPQIEARYGIPSGTLWKLHYRPKEELPTGAYFSLLSTAKAVLAEVRASADRDLALVAGIEAERTAETDRALHIGAELRELERQVSAARAETHQ